MHAAYVVVVALTAGANLVAAVGEFLRPRWLLDTMAECGVPHSWVFPLGSLKAAGAIGLLLGFAVPPIGLAAATGLVLYFVGATFTFVRARLYARIPYPAAYLLLATASLALQCLR
nr:DoxX family protein [Kibdelosporangium sp. MJ126-NF4]CEL13361.1 integral membrane protein [Kibdelosporangium sp. MJ126-NF4]CTQ99051.1 integral membrane protein [Kibdelosporangium sp. MJ126-NF4]